MVEKGDNVKRKPRKLMGDALFLTLRPNKGVGQLTNGIVVRNVIVPKAKGKTLTKIANDLFLNGAARKQFGIGQ